MMAKGEDMTDDERKADELVDVCRPLFAAREPTAQAIALARLTAL
jgi:hypothetical protein